MGDFNVKIGERKHNQIVGPMGWCYKQSMVEWCERTELIVTNTSLNVDYTSGQVQLRKPETRLITFLSINDTEMQ